MFRSGFFTSDSWTVNGDGFAIGNKAEGSDFLAKIVSVAVTDGVPYLPTSNLQVTATTGMILSVGAGFGFKDGYMAWETADTTITCTSSASEQTLYISARLDTTTGEFTGGKVDKYTTFVAATDICFAIVVIPANAVTITSAMITDVRGNATYCGYITDQREYLETLTAWLQNEIAKVIAGGMPDHASTHAAAGDDPITPAAIGAAASTHKSNHAYGGSDVLAASDIGQYGIPALASGGKVGNAFDTYSFTAHSANYTLAAGDEEHKVHFNADTTFNYTIPPNVFAVGTIIPFYVLAGKVTFVAGSGVTLEKVGGYATVAGLNMACIIQRAANYWIIVGGTE